MSEERLVDIKYHFIKDVDPCTYCRNINKCISQHWKRCKPSFKPSFQGKSSQRKTYV